MKTKSNKSENGFNLYQHITDKIIEALEKGVGPWVRPWDDSGVQFIWPRNALSARPYNGINVLLLNMVALEKGYTDPRWVTFTDVKKRGGHINKGERHTKIVFWKFLERRDRQEDDDTHRDEHTGKKVIPLLRYYRVFNVQQCKGLKLKELQKPEPETAAGGENIRAEKILSLPDIRTGGNRAVYHPGQDIIQLPPKTSFKNLQHYYATGFHETVHWSGHGTRLTRSFGKRFGDDTYAMEELVAEIGSAFLGGHVGLPFTEMRHPEYIQSWITSLKNDNRAIFTACRMAQAASDYILKNAGIDRPEDQTAAVL